MSTPAPVLRVDVPSDVIQLEREDLARAQPEAGQEEQDRERTAATSSRAIGCRYCDHMLDLLGSEERWDGGELPPTNGKHGRREISRRRAIDEAETQERAQRRRQQPHERGRAISGMVEQVAVDRQ